MIKRVKGNLESGKGRKKGECEKRGKSWLKSDFFGGGEALRRTDRTFSIGGFTLPKTDLLNRPLRVYNIISILPALV